MKRRRVLGGAALALLIAAGAFALTHLGEAEIPSADVPVFVVSRGRFHRAVAAEGTLQAVRTTPITAPRDLTGAQRIAWMAPDGAVVRAGEVVARIDPTNLELDLADGMDELEIARLKIQQSGKSQEARRENLSLDSNLAHREDEYTRTFTPQDPRIFSRQEIIDAEIDRDLSEGKLLSTREKLEVAAEQGRTEMEMLQIDRARAEEKVARARKGLAALAVRAPHDGILLLRRDFYGEVIRPGMDVWPGMKLAEIPDPAVMQARVYVLDSDAEGLKPGNGASLRVEAHPDKTYRGKVERVDALAKRRTWSLPTEYFETVVKPETTDTSTMKPGQGITAEITLESIENAFTIPPQAIFQIEGKPVVFRKEGAGFAAVPVRTGARSLSRVQVESGVREGDALALRDPRRKPSFAPPEGAEGKASASSHGGEP